MTEEELRAVVKIAGGELESPPRLLHKINEKDVFMYVVHTNGNVHRFFETSNDDAAVTILNVLNMRRT